MFKYMGKHIMRNVEEKARRESKVVIKTVLQANPKRGRPRKKGKCCK